MTADSERDAVSAAADARVSITAVADLAAVDELRDVMAEIWGPSVVPPRNVLRAMSFAGSGLLLARRHDRVVGFSMGLVGWSGGIHFHSHQVGVVADLRSEGVGFALKMAQRAECLSHGITEMRWTFDPLLRSNAAFNLIRLGATVIDFIPNAYGERVDAFNTGDVTDRVKVSWDMTTPVGREASAVVAGCDLVAIPERYHALKEADPGAASRWRSEVGSRLADAFTRGRRVVGFTGDAYVLG